ncbi:SRPBCC family protein [Bacillus salitolerans]|uniref:SRPBCC family protein n=1 Tax=Bacillus salitolerans TaxID=1437434 RepID=A0ABW4LXX2_9BACI
MKGRKKYNRDGDNMAFKREVWINAPLEKVFEIASDLRNSAAILEHVVDVQLLSEGPISKGTKLKEVREIRGRKAEALIVVTEFIPNQKYSVKSENNGLFVEYHYTFHPKDSGTIVQFEGVIHTKGFMNVLFKPVIASIIKKEDGNHLEDLKKYIEQQNDNKEEATTVQ